MNSEKHLSNYINANTKIDLDRIIDDFTPYIRNVVNNMSKEYLSYEDKEEIIADTFFILWKNKCKEIIYLDSYIAGIARSLVRERFKKNNIVYDISDYENTIPYYDELELLSYKRGQLERLNIGYKSLKEIDFKIITMFYYYSKSIKDISKELKMSEANVKKKLHRIRNRLKKELEIGGEDIG